MRTIQNRRAVRWTAVVAAALMLHGAALWALQMGLMRQAAEVAPAPAVSVIEVIVRRADLTYRPVAALLPVARPAPRPTARPVQAKPEPKPRSRVLRTEPPPPSERPMPVVEPAPESAPAVTAQSVPDVSADAVQTDSAPVQAASSADATGLPAQQQASVVPPSANAAYLRNPPPDYPPMSRLRHESGTVVVRVLIGADGHAQAARIEQSSGYARLDEAALATARDRWRYRPGTRGGVPEAMWFDVPLRFVLQ